MGGRMGRILDGFLLLNLTMLLVGAALIGSILWVWGQPPICTCGEVRLWVGSIFAPGNSQHIADWYTPSHIIHGLGIGLLWRGVFPKAPYGWFLLLAMGTGIVWELIEHSSWVLEKFRATTVNQGYVGDSVLNAVSDFVWMMGGFFVAAFILRPSVTIIVIVALEVTAMIVARDSLILTTLTVVWPHGPIGAWQSALLHG